MMLLACAGAGPPPATGGSHILHRLDDSEHAAHALEAARERAAARGATALDYGPHGQRAKTALDAGELETALREIRLEIEDARSRPKGYQGNIRTLALDVLREYQRFHGVAETLDDEAERYYREALHLLSENGDGRALVDYVYANYFAQTGRNGLALPYVRKEFDHWKRARNAYQIIKSLDAYANIFNDRGDLKARDEHRKMALDEARRYFRFPESPSDPNEWRNYERFLFHRASEAAEEGRQQELRGLWTHVQPIADRFARYPYRSYLLMAQRLAAAGDAASAERVYRAGERLAGRASDDPEARFRVACARAVIDVWSRRGNAADEFDRCLALRAAVHRDLDSGTAHIGGLAFERAGQLDRAIELFRASTDRLERTRDSYSVEERAAFFRGLARKPYWGLIRTSVSRARGSGSAADFAEALSTSELVRARQLGDRIDPDAEGALTRERVEELQGMLRPDEVIVDTLLTDTAIIVFGMSRGEWVAELVPYDPRSFRADLSTAASMLADPRSSPSELRERLDNVGRVVLEPVAPLLREKQRIIALPDGSLNLVPFELLGDPERPGMPLFERYAVRTVPSLRLFLARRSEAAWSGKTTFLAVADPEFGSLRVPTVGVRLEELSGATRGIGFSNYFDPLPETRSEVQRIASLLQDQRARLVLGEQATESFLKSTELRSYRFLHLATHGILGGGVSGVGEPALVMADEPGEDGFLTASEAAKLNIRAELTVLSACKTGSGDYVRGEGVNGMSRAFLLAGSRSVVVSLWDVDSRATEHLMVAFYRQVLAGVDPEGALALAKRETQELFQPKAIDVEPPALAKQLLAPQGLHPFYWAGFILVGG